MNKKRTSRAGVPICTVFAISALAGLPDSVLAQTATPANDQIKQLQNEIRNIQKNYQTQIRNLQKQLDDLKAAQAATPKPPPPAAPAAPAGLAIPPTAGALPPPVPGGPGAAPPPTEVAAKRGGIFGTGINVSFANTFIEAASIFRTRNETADIGSNFNTGIPMPNSSNYYLSEFRESPHQSRVATLAEGSTAISKPTSRAQPRAQTVQSNSYTLRLRQAYATVDKNDWGTYILGGQAWSLLTLFKDDMTPRQEDIPLTIDAQYVPGFSWTRNPQFRVVQHFGDLYAVGLSLESPQAVIFSGPNAPFVPVTFNNPGGSGLNPSTTYSTDVGPDIVAKVSADPGWGNFAAYGVGRLFRSRANFSNHTILGGGGGLGAVLPIIPKLLDFQADFLAGNGIGRYGSAGLPYVTVKPTGVLAPIPEIQALVGLVGHPTPLSICMRMAASRQPIRPRLRSTACLSATATCFITTAVVCTRDRRCARRTLPKSGRPPAASGGMSTKAISGGFGLVDKARTPSVGSSPASAAGPTPMKASSWPRYATIRSRPRARFCVAP